MEISGQYNVPAALPPGKYPFTHWTGGWVSTIAGLDTLDKTFSPVPEFLARIVLSVL
jgi:hypothetical protein